MLRNVSNVNGYIIGPPLWCCAARSETLHVLLHEMRASPFGSPPVPSAPYTGLREKSINTRPFFDVIQDTKSRQHQSRPFFGIFSLNVKNSTSIHFYSEEISINGCGLFQISIIHHSNDGTFCYLMISDVGWPFENEIKRKSISMRI